MESKETLIIEQKPLICGESNVSTFWGHPVERICVGWEIGPIHLIYHSKKSNSIFNMTPTYVSPQRKTGYANTAHSILDNETAIGFHDHTNRTLATGKNNINHKRLVSSKMNGILTFKGLN